MARTIRGRERVSLQRARIGAPDVALTANGGLAVVSELCDRLGVIAAIDVRSGRLKQRDTGAEGGGLLAGIAGSAAGRGRIS